MIGTLFRIRKYMRDAKKGIASPSDFAFEQLTEMALVPLFIPGIIITVILVALGIIGFSHWPFDGGSSIARIFFWIFLVFAGITIGGMIIVYRGMKKLWKRGARSIGVEGKGIRDITGLQKDENTV